MQARRRFTTSESDESNLTTEILVVDDNNGLSSKENQLLIPTGSTTINSNNNITDEDNKYTKSWNFKTLTNRIQITSGNALRSWLPQINLENNHRTTSAAIFSTLTNSSTSSTSGGSRLGGIFSGGDFQNNINNNNSKIIGGGTKQYQYLEENCSEDESPNYFDKNQIVVMTCRDRTTEFANAIRSLQSRNISRAVNIKDPRRAKQAQTFSEFMMVAKYIGKNIASTYAKLEKLTLLAKKKSLFDDRPHEIQELTYIIKGDLNALNQQIARLQDISKEQRRSTNHGKHLQSHSSNMVLALQSKLANMSTDFKQILEVRTENLKQQKSRRDQFSQGSMTTGISSSAAKQGSLLLAEENQISIDMSSAASSSEASASGVNNNFYNSRLMQQQQQPQYQQQHQQYQQQQQIMLYDESDNYVQQRAETMQNIESTIVELGGIFQQLAHMVKEQEEIVERIDTNVIDAELNIEAAHGEILKYFQSVSKNRWLMIKIFGVLIFFFIFFVIFMT